MQIDLTRNLFEDLVADLLERTRVTTELLVRQAGRDWGDVDRVLLSGGATRMPMVSRILRELIGKEPDSSLSPDEAVAHGAALYAGMLLGNPGSGGLRRCELIHVNSHSLGVVGVEEKSQQRVNAVLIPRNTPIPAQAIKSFRTIEEGQRNVAVPVVEGESERPEFCVPLGKCVVRGLPPGLPKGTRVDVAYRYLANGRLAVSAWVPDSGKSAEVEILRDRPSIQGDLAEWKRRLLGKQAPPETGEAPGGRLPEVDVNDRASVIKRLDALYVRVGRLAEKMAVPPPAAGSQRLVSQARADLNAKSQAVADVESRREGAVGMGEAVRRGVELSRAQADQRQAADYLFYACLVLGRECAQNGFCPPGAEADLEEIRRLRPFLN
jgi:molecular chaperone DnaK (HSP70)